MTLTCIICPKGCTLTIEEIDGVLTVSGNTCKRGEHYAVEECTHPTRTLTSIIRVSNRTDTMVSVKTAAPIPKEHLFDAMARIRAVRAAAPITVGDVLLKDLFGTELLATKTVF